MLSATPTWSAKRAGNELQSSFSYGHLSQKMPNSSQSRQTNLESHGILLLKSDFCDAGSRKPGCQMRVQQTRRKVKGIIGVTMWSSTTRYPFVTPEIYVTKSLCLTIPQLLLSTRRIHIALKPAPYSDPAQKSSSLLFLPIHFALVITSPRYQ